MSTHKIGFYEDLTKFFFELSSNTHLISSTEHNLPFQCYCLQSDPETFVLLLHMLNLKPLQ